MKTAISILYSGGVMLLLAALVSADELDRYLDADGRLDPNVSLEGSLDATGFTVSTDGPPRFRSTVALGVDQTCEADNWDSRFVRPGQISASRLVAANGKLYVAGTVSLPVDQGGGSRGTAAVGGIFTWDGAQWHYPTVDMGLDGGGGSWSFTDLMVYGNEVIASGTFVQTTGGDMTIKYIARWDGAAWHALGDGVNNTVQCLATTGNLDVYAGGQFTLADGEAANRVARWTPGGGWEPLWDQGMATEGTNGGVNALTVTGNMIILGGGFGSAGGAVVSNLAGWNYSTHEWVNIGNGVNDGVVFLASWGSDIYVVGADTAGNSVPITGVAHWDGSQWYDLPLPQYAGIQGMEMSNSGEVVIIGNFTTDFEAERRNIAKWNPLTSQWEALSTECNLVNAPPLRLAIDGSQVYVIPGAIFAESSCGNRVDGIAMLDNGRWRGLGEGMNTNSAWGLALDQDPDGDNMYLGGLYGYLGGAYRENSIARWNETDQTWHEFEAGGTSGLDFSSFTAYCWDVEAAGGDTAFFGGQFTSAGDLTTRHIVGWDGNGYFALGGGADYSTTVYALERFQGDLYVGGQLFTLYNTDMSTVSPGGIARWDGTDYNIPAGGNMSGLVMDMEAAGDYLYVAGQWTYYYPTQPSANVIRTDGVTWDSVGGGTNGRVYDVDVAGPDVFVAGGFTQAINPDGSTVDAHRLARFDGTEWHALGDFNDTVRAVFVRGGEIYAGGHFTMVDGITARHIAFYDGTEWKALGEGTEGLEFTNNGEVFDLESDGNFLWMTGKFTHAGNLPSTGVSRWGFCTAAPPDISGPGTGAEVDGTTVTLTWGGGGGVAGFSPDAITYTLEVDTSSSFTDPVVTVSGISATYYTLTNLEEYQTYSWRIRTDDDGDIGAWSTRQTFTTSSPTAVDEVTDGALPVAFSLSQNYPNPFNPSTTIGFGVPSRSRVTITVLNLLGQKVATLVDETLGAGEYETVWEGADEVASGVYFYRMTAGDFEATRKMLLLK